MDGSQLPTEWTHHHSNLDSGVSESKKRDGSLKQSDTALENGPMTQKKEDVKKMSEMSESSKNVNMAESSESCSVR